MDGKKGKDQGSDSTKPVAWPSAESTGALGRGAPTREELRESLPIQQPLKTQERQNTFPEEAVIEYERSVIRIPFYLKGRAKEAHREIDILAFDAYMRLIREKPIRNGIGFRQFEFYIDAWELTNTYSKGLNADITFTLSDTDQPKSVC